MDGKGGFRGGNKAGASLTPRYLGWAGPSAGGGGGVGCPRASSKAEGITTSTPHRRPG